MYANYRTGLGLKNHVEHAIALIFVVTPNYTQCGPGDIARIYTTRPWPSNRVLFLPVLSVSAKGFSGKCGKDA